MNQKRSGPKFIKPTPKAEPQDNRPKADFDQLRPPGVHDTPADRAGQNVAAIHEAQAAAARAEDRVKKGEEDEPEEEKKEEEQEPLPDDPTLDQMASDFAQRFRSAELLNDPEQKELIEKRLAQTPIKLKDMFELGEFRQRVPIMPGDFEPEFRTITAEEDIKLKALMSKEDEDMSVRYIQDKYATLQLICAVRKINDEPLPVHFSNKSGWLQEEFERKGKIIMRLPIPAIWSLMVHNQWFDERCRKVFKIEDLKNG
jgi:hypothetical protein